MTATLAAAAVVALTCYFIFRDIARSAADQSLMTGDILHEQTTLTAWEQERLGWIEQGEQGEKP